MGRPFHRLLMWLGLGLVLVAAPVATAFPEPVDFDGSLSRWNIGPSDAPVTYGLEADDPDDVTTFQAVVDQAADLWNHVPGSYFRYSAVAADQSPQVTIHLKHNLDGTRSTAGYTYFDKYDGNKPLHCMIVVLVDDTVSFRSIAKTVLHEMGHGLGLGHSLVPQSIMSYSLHKNGFALDVDDHAAVARLYPVSGDGPKLPPGCSIGAQLGSTAGTSQQAIFLLLLPLLLPTVGRPSTMTRRLNQSPASDRSPASP